LRGRGLNLRPLGCQVGRLPDYSARDMRQMVDLGRLRRRPHAYRAWRSNQLGWVFLCLVTNYKVRISLFQLIVALKLIWYFIRPKAI